MKKFIIVTVSVMFTWHFSTAQQMEYQINDVTKVAAASLPTMQKLVTESNFQNMGFRSAAEAKSASLGRPLALYTVPLNELVQYREGGDPARIIHFGDRILFPVMVNNEVRSSLQVDKSGDKWEVSSYGGPNRMKLISDAINRLSADPENKGMEYRVITIPAMNLYFIGMQKDDKLFLASVLDDEAYGVKAGEVVSAEIILPKLAEIAATLKDEPR